MSLSQEANIGVGDIVFIGTTGLRGIVRYAGLTQFASGDWLGVELYEKSGKNDGSVKGQRYFDCAQAYGLFVRPTAVQKVEAPSGSASTSARRPSPKGRKSGTRRSPTDGGGPPSPPIVSPLAAQSLPARLSATPAPVAPTAPPAPAAAAPAPAPAVVEAGAAPTAAAPVLAAPVPGGEVPLLQAAPAQTGSRRRSSRGKSNSKQAAGGAASRSTPAPPGRRRSSGGARATADGPQAIAIDDGSDYEDDGDADPGEEGDNGEIARKSSLVEQLDADWSSLVGQHEADWSSLAEQHKNGDWSKDGKTLASEGPKHSGPAVRRVEADQEAAYPLASPAPTTLAPVASDTVQQAATATNGASAAPTPSPQAVLSAEELKARQVAAQRELAQAAEDHDAEGLKEALVKAKAAGVKREELESAHRILNFEVQQALLFELEGVRSAVASLAKAVEVAEARAAEAERRAAAAAAALAAPGAAARLLPAGGTEELERRVWEGLERKVEDAITGAVARATRELAELAAAAGEARLQREAAPMVSTSTVTAEPPPFNGRTSFVTRRTLIAPSFTPPLSFPSSEARASQAGRGSMVAVRSIVRSATFKPAVDTLDEVLEADSDLSPARFAIRLALVGAAKRYAPPATDFGLDAVSDFGLLAPAAPPPFLAAESGRLGAGGGLAGLQEGFSAAQLFGEVEASLAVEDEFEGAVARLGRKRTSTTQALAAASALLSGGADTQGRRARPSVASVGAAGAWPSAGSAGGGARGSLLQGAGPLAPRRPSAIGASLVGRPLLGPLPPSPEEASPVQALPPVREEPAVDTRQAVRRDAKQEAKAAVGMVLRRASQAAFEAANTKQMAFSAVRLSLIGASKVPDARQLARSAVRLSLTRALTLTPVQEDPAIVTRWALRQCFKGALQYYQRAVSAEADRADAEARRCLDEIAAASQRFEAARIKAADRAEVLAATKVQAATRGMLVRQSIKNGGTGELPVKIDHLMAALQESDAIRASAQRMEVAMARMAAEADRAASRMQAAARGRLTRKSIVLQKEKAHVLQRIARGWIVRRRLGDNGSRFAQTVALARTQHSARAAAFDAARGAEPGLGRQGLASALSTLGVSLSAAQVAALWDNYVERADSICMDLRTFCSLAEAVAEGPYAAAEFADMSPEAWAALGGAVLERRGTTLGQQVTPASPSQDASRTVNPELKAIFNQAGGREEGLDQAGFAKAIAQAAPQLAAAQVSCLWKGYTAGTQRDRMDLSDFCAIVEAVRAGVHEAAEFADVSAEVFEALGAPGAEEAAVRLQALERGRQFRGLLKRQDSAIRTIQGGIRGWQRKRRSEMQAGVDPSSIASATYSVRKRFPDWASLYDRAIAEQREIQAGVARERAALPPSGDEAEDEDEGEDSVGGPGLIEGPFCEALQHAHPRLQPAQVYALWSGFCEGTGRDHCDLKNFCLLLEAVCQGDDVAAEFADMTLEAFQALGVPPPPPEPIPRRALSPRPPPQAQEASA